MMCPAYDTSEGITRALTSLERFHRLLEDRRSAHARGEALTEFCVRGRWWLDDRGGTRIALIKGKRSSVRSLFPELPDVVPAAELLGLLTETNDVAWGLAGLMVPPVGPPCAGCGKTWTMDTAGDFRARRVDEARDISEHIGRSLAYVRRRLSESYPGRPTIANWVRNPGDFGDGTAREVPDGYVTRNGDQVFVEAWRAFHTACWESKARTW